MPIYHYNRKHIDLHPTTDRLLRSLAYTKRKTLQSVVLQALGALPRSLAALGLPVVRSGKSVIRIGNGKNVPYLNYEGIGELEALVERCHKERLPAYLVLHQGLLSVLRTLGPENLVEVPDVALNALTWFSDRSAIRNITQAHTTVKLSRQAQGVMDSYGCGTLLDALEQAPVGSIVPVARKAEGSKHIYKGEHDRLYKLAKLHRLSLRYALEVAAQLVLAAAEAEATGESLC